MADDLENQAAPEEEEDAMAREMAEAMKAEGQAAETESSSDEGGDAGAASEDVESPNAETEHNDSNGKGNGVESKTLSTLQPQENGTPLGNLDFILDVPLQVTVNLGNAKMLIKELLQLGQGSVVELEKMAGEPMDVLIGDKLVARGDVVVVNEKFGVRLTDIVSTVDRIQNLG
ncbi:MAG: flagellar motor switch protein FliN [Nitrospiria bacterium]